jgi:uncharacterized membrane protein
MVFAIAIGFGISVLVATYWVTQVSAPRTYGGAINQTYSYYKELVK